MLSSPDDLKKAILALPMASSKAEGIANLVDAIGDYVDNVQGGPLGSPGIFKLNRPVMTQALMALSPVPDDSWVNIFASAFELGSNAAIITPGTVSNPIWLGSASKDVNTLPIGAASILTVSLAKSLLVSSLSTAKPDSDSPQPMAEGIHNGMLAFIFECIGLGTPPVFPPIPIPTSAQ